MLSCCNYMMVLLCKAVLSFRVQMCTLFLYMNCLGVLHIISLYGALSLHKSAHLQVDLSSRVRQNNRGYHALKTITLTYYKNYNFIYSNTTVTVTYMYIKHSLFESCVRCSSHISLPSICLHSGVKCGAQPSACVTGTGAAAETGF